MELSTNPLPEIFKFTILIHYREASIKRQRLIRFFNLLMAGGNKKVTYTEPLILGRLGGVNF